MLRSCLFFLLGLSTAIVADDGEYEYGGHSKARINAQSYADDSLFRDIAGSSSIDAAGELRLNFLAKRNRWSFHADYQFIALRSEFLPAGAPTDDRRRFDLTRLVGEGGDSVIVHRLDRLWVGFSGDKIVLRAGRQALSWGNGLFFAPMDLVNPFDPTTIDTEYKTGDDMLYGQYLRDNGDDVQGAVVLRRDPVSAAPESDQATVALKYHGFAGESEYDVLIAESYSDTVLGLGGAGSVGGAVWRGDIVVTDSSDDTTVEVVTNLSYSWTWSERNVSGMAEYYYDGVDRHYLAGGLTIEMSALLTVSPTLISNIDDPSAMLQLVTRYSLSDNATFLGSINLPLGSDGTEFAGSESGVPGRYLSFDVGVFAQLAWYF